MGRNGRSVKPSAKPTLVRVEVCCARAVLNGLLPPRRPRVSDRKVRSPLSRWNKADPHRPAKSTPVTAIGITLQQPPEQQPATRRRKCLTAAPSP